MREKLDRNTKEDLQKQKVIDYMNLILTNTSQSGRISVEKAIELEIIQFEAEMLKQSTSDRYKKLEMKMA